MGLSSGVSVFSCGSSPVSDGSGTDGGSEVSSWSLSFFCVGRKDVSGEPPYSPGGSPVMNRSKSGSASGRSSWDPGARVFRILAAGW